jgi:hypothetical protein
MAALSKAAAHHRAKIANIKRAVQNGERPADDPALKEAERNYCAARMADYAKQLVAKWPPLTPEQIDTVAQILRAGAA